MKSSISEKDYPTEELIKGRAIRQGVLTEIRKDHPQFGHNDYIAIAELNRYRQSYVENKLKEELGTLSHLEHKVIKSITQREFLSDNINETHEQQQTFGQHLADRIAAFGGSWSFIMLFSGFIALWMAGNVVLLLNKGFDPYPFILLNLILSSLAAFQAPVIMMSQNRQEEKNRKHAENDYLVNLKSELEIRSLHEKLDHLMQVQQERELEFQEMQIEMMKEMMNELSGLKGRP